MTSLILTILILLIFINWFNGTKAKEKAIQIAKEKCKENGLQFLDETVNQTRIGVRWGAGRLYIRRMFYFDFSMSGIGRRSGWMILKGTDIEAFDLDLPKTNPSEDTIQRDNENRLEEKLIRKKVIPFKKPKTNKK